MKEVLMKNRNDKITERTVQRKAGKQFRRLPALLLAVLFVFQTVLSFTGLRVSASESSLSVFSPEQHRAKYVVVTTNLEKTLTASDGATYQITVKCGPSSGIPANAQLEVRELSENENQEYLSMAEEAGADMEGLAWARAFDITIVDPYDSSIVYEPNGDVEVMIRLVGEELDAYDGIDVLHFVEEESADTVSVEEVGPAVNGEEIAFTTESFSVYIIAAYTIEKVITAGDGRSYKITVSYDESAGIPAGSELSVEELDGEACEDYLNRAAMLMNAVEFSYGRVFDISILDADGEKIQPLAPVQVTAQLLDTDPEEDPEDFAVLHFESDGSAEETGTEPEQMEASTEGDTVSFSTDGFSAYAIVKGPVFAETEWTKVLSMQELISHSSTGLYIGHIDGYYFTGTGMTISGSRTGITKTKPAQSVPAESAVPYYFEQAEGTEDQFYVYCLSGSQKKYVKNANNNSLSFTDENGRTAFTVSVSADGVVTLQRNGWYWNMQGGANGKAFAAYQSATDVNAKLNCWYHTASGTDPFELDGKDYGLMNYTDGVAGKAVMAEQNGTKALGALAMTVMTREGDYGDRLFVPDDSEITRWHFTWIGDGRYYITADRDGSTAYLKIEKNAVSLSSVPEKACEIKVIPGTGIHEGEICLRSDAAVLTYSGNVENGFTAGTAAGNEWLNLTDISELTADYFMTYSARKVGISDADVMNGSKIILYTRSWDDEKKKYVFYAVDHDGSLVRCFESGDSVQWVGSRLNTLLWNFVEYYEEGTNQPNYYYELYNQYSEKFIAPQIAGEQILSEEPVGINLNGRRKGSYYSTIVAWDKGEYAYAGLKAENGSIAACPLKEADDFYFAIMQDESADSTLTTVPTVDHTQYGIKMKLVNFPEKPTGKTNIQDEFLGSSAGGMNVPPTQGLLSTDLGEDGYPKNKSGESMSTLYAGAQEVNHLFIQSTYSGSGYYEYDSTQNFASYDTASGDFKVYRELGTMDVNSRNSLKHGQFMPFNDLEAGVFASVNRRNLYDALMKELPDSDPRKNEQMYLVRTPDYYFGTAIEAQFTQTPDGLDAWGHDIIYEFTGDDDFWFYVDGELIIDLGGIHSALAGSVNFSTGEVSVYKTKTTIRDLFYNNYIGRGHTKEEAQAYIDEKFEKNSKGQYIFKPYTSHTMSIFYMERGAGASNLHMRFNLASIKPGTVELSKELAGVDASESVLAEFPFQIRYKTAEDGDQAEGRLLVPDGDQLAVHYKDTVTPAEYRPEIGIDGITYENVYFLKAGEVVEIELPEEAVSYAITECGVNTDVYSNVAANGAALSGTPVKGKQDRSDFETEYASSAERARVAFVNTVDPDALRTLTITKKLYREDGVTPIRAGEDGSLFNLRLYFGTEFASELAPADMHVYHVKDPDGQYCSWDAAQQRFIPTGKSVYADLTDSEKAAASFTTSMNGSISKLPAGYSAEIREILSGTQYKIEEREEEIPDGYSLQKYVLHEDASDGGREQEGPVSGTITTGKDPLAEVCNLRGWGLRVRKQWTDAAYMASRDPVYFAVFTGQGQGGLELVDGTVRQLKQNESTLYWYFRKLPVSGTEFDDYQIYEVSVEGETVSPDGLVTSYSSVTPVEENGELTVNGTQKGESGSSAFRYTVLYERGGISADSNVRVDTVTNNRPGILLKKQDWSGRPLQGASFELKDETGSRIGSFTSDSTGLITVAFLRDNTDYILTETKSPKGYSGPESPVTIRLDKGNVTVSGEDPAYYALEQGSGGTPSLILKNRPFVFRAVKIDGDSGEPLEGVHFALHRQVTVNGVTSVDLQPMAGYEDLVTGGDGSIPGLNEKLAAGTYELREKEAAEGYRTLDSHIRFAVSPTGTVSLVSGPDGAVLEKEEQEDGTLAFILSVSNYPDEEPVAAPTGIRMNTRPYLWILVFGALLGGLFVWRGRRKQEKGGK